MEQFLSSTRSLPADEAGFVRDAQVEVDLENRRAVEALRVGSFQNGALRDGKLDRKYFGAIMAAAPEAALGALRVDEPPPGWVPAKYRFAKATPRAPHHVEAD